MSFKYFLKITEMQILKIKTTAASFKKQQNLSMCLPLLCMRSQNILNWDLETWWQVMDAALMPRMYENYADKYVNNGNHVATARTHIKYKPVLPSGAHSEVSEVDRDMCAYIVNFRVETNQFFLLSTH